MSLHPPPNSSAQVPDETEISSIKTFSRPDLPGPLTLLEIWALGVPTAFCSMLMAAGLVALIIERFPRTHMGALALLIGGAIFPLVVLSRYKDSLTSTKRNRKRWVFLTMPAFIVVGALVGGVGVVVMYNASPHDDEFFAGKICNDLNRYKGGERFRACTSVARVCVRQLTQEAYMSTRGDAVECTQAALASSHSGVANGELP